MKKSDFFKKGFLFNRREKGFNAFEGNIFPMKVLVMSDNGRQKHHQPYQKN